MQKYYPTGCIMNSARQAKTFYEYFVSSHNTKHIQDLQIPHTNGNNTSYMEKDLSLKSIPNPGY